MATPPTRVGTPFFLTWNRWTRLLNASPGAFNFRVLVGIRRIPAHALSTAVLQQLLGSSCAQIVVATPDDDGVDADDPREIFVAAWCIHPTLIPEQKIVVIPEPTPPHDPHGCLFLREHEVIHPNLPAMRYLARLRVVEFQDWDAPDSSDDDDEFPSFGDGADGRDDPWPGFVRRPSLRPPTFRRRGTGGLPSLGCGVGAAFRPWRAAGPTAGDGASAAGGA